MFQHSLTERTVPVSEALGPVAPIHLPLKLSPRLASFSKSPHRTKRLRRRKRIYGQKLKGSFLPGVAFAKWREFLLVFLGKGFGVGFRGVGGGRFSCGK